MILYKYINNEGGVKIVKDQRIKLGDITTFNDPFELRENIVHESSVVKDFVRNEFEVSRERAIGHFCITCFCEDKIDCKEELLMWAYYAKGHTGFRFHFNFSKATLPNGAGLKKVNYLSERIPFDVQRTYGGKGINDFIQGISYAMAVQTEVLYSKSDIWKHEHEVRLVVPTCHCENGKYWKLDFGIIARIDCGVLCPVEKIEAMKILLTGKGIGLWKAKVDLNDFKLNYIQII